MAASATNDGDLIIDDAVISAGILADRVANMRRVLIGARAVVTPSARDLLKEKNITLVRALKAMPSNSVRVILAVADSKIDASSIVRSLQQHVSVDQLSAVGLVEAVTALADQLSKNGTTGVLLTANVAAALCIANRRHGVRAATASNRGELNDVLRSVGANLLIVDSLRRSPAELQRIIEAFAAAPSHECPAELKAALE